MPKLWNDTIETHRRAVREATLDATAALVAEHGLRGVTMSQIAEKTGIGRATLYKYFPDVESILVAWHERQVGGHLEQLAEIRDRAGEPGERLLAVLEAYALIHQRRMRHHNDEPRGAELAMFLHRDEHLAQPHLRLREMIRNLVAEAAAAGAARDDIEPDELAGFCLNAINAAGELPSKAAVQRLITVIQTALGLRK